MCAWMIAQDYHASGAIAVREVNDVPILTAHVGRYPTAIAEDGRTTRKVPYVRIDIHGGTADGAAFYNGVSVTVYGEADQAGRQRHLRVFEDVNYGAGRRDARPDAWVQLGETKVQEALRILADIDVTYEAADKALAPARSYVEPLTRSAYEAACQHCELDPLSDEDCQSYGVQYGVFFWGFGFSGGRRTWKQPSRQITLRIFWCTTPIF